MLRTLQLTILPRNDQGFDEGVYTDLHTGTFQRISRTDSFFFGAILRFFGRHLLGHMCHLSQFLPNLFILFIRFLLFLLLLLRFEFPNFFLLYWHSRVPP